MLYRHHYALVYDVYGLAGGRAFQSRTTRKSAKRLLQRFGGLQVGIAGCGFLLVITGLLDTLLVLVNQLEPLLGDFLLRLV